MEDYRAESGHEPQLLSDHFALYINIYTPLQRHPPYKRRKINIPSYLTSVFCTFIAAWFENYKISGVQAFHDDLVFQIHKFQDCYLNKSGKRKENRCWTGDEKLHKFKEELANVIENYKTDNNATNLKHYLLKLNEFRELKSTVRIDHFNQFLQTLNAHTSASTV